MNESVRKTRSSSRMLVRFVPKKRLMIVAIEKDNRAKASSSKKVARRRPTIYSFTTLPVRD